MKKYLLILVLFSVFIFNAMGIERLLTHQDTVGYWKVVNAIMEVESGGNSNAKSECGRYIGALQISQVVVRDCNEYLRSKGSSTRYTLLDRYDKKKSREMFYIIQKRYNSEKDLEKAIRIWNGGPKYNKKSTDKYYNKVLSNLVKVE